MYSPFRTPFQGQNPYNKKRSKHDIHADEPPERVDILLTQSEFTGEGTSPQSKKSSPGKKPAHSKKTEKPASATSKKASAVRLKYNSIITTRKSAAKKQQQPHRAASKRLVIRLSTEERKSIDDMTSASCISSPGTADSDQDSDKDKEPHNSPPMSPPVSGYTEQFQKFLEGESGNDVGTDLKGADEDNCDEMSEKMNEQKSEVESNANLDSKSVNAGNNVKSASTRGIESVSAGDNVESASTRDNVESASSENDVESASAVDKADSVLAGDNVDPAGAGDNSVVSMVVESDEETESCHEDQSLEVNTEDVQSPQESPNSIKAVKSGVFLASTTIDEPPELDINSALNLKAKVASADKQVLNRLESTLKKIQDSAISVDDSKKKVTKKEEMSAVKDSTKGEEITDIRITEKAKEKATKVSSQFKESPRTVGSEILKQLSTSAQQTPITSLSDLIKVPPSQESTTDIPDKNDTAGTSGVQLEKTAPPKSRELLDKLVMTCKKKLGVSNLSLI